MRVGGISGVVCGCCFLTYVRMYIYIYISLLACGIIFCSSGEEIEEPLTGCMGFVKD